jgi:CheY-like chemotaxis protein
VPSHTPGAARTSYTLRMKGNQVTATILVVEEDSALRGLLLDLLEDEGYQAIAASDGRAALGLARQHCPRAILLDAGLPIASGWTVVQQRKTSERTGDIPVIVLTGPVKLSTGAVSQRPNASRSCQVEQPACVDG